MKIKFFSHSFGCRVNYAEKLALDSELISNGFIQSETDPDICIINTCAVTNKAEKESRQYLHKLRKNFPESKIILTGCAATNWNNKNIFHNDGIFIMKNNQKQEIMQLAVKLFKTSDNLKKIYPMDDKFINSGRMIIKIGDGCSRFCTFCIVPYLRGKPKTVPVDDIIKTINSNIPNISEAILCAINTEYIGKEKNIHLVDYLQEVLDKTNIKRVSLGSVHPWCLTEKFYRWYEKNKNNDRLVHFFHIPIQSGSDTMLKIMNRGYTADYINEKIKQIKQINPFVLIGTDIITGYYGETDYEFGETYQFLSNSKIDKFHVFRYSHRKGTFADKIKLKYPEVDAQTKQTRSNKLITLGKRKYIQFMDSLIGKRMVILNLKHQDGKFMQGLTSNQVPVLIESSKETKKTFLYLEIIKRLGDKLIAA